MKQVALFQYKMTAISSWLWVVTNAITNTVMNVFRNVAWEGFKDSLKCWYSLQLMLGSTRIYGFVKFPMFIALMFAIVHLPTKLIESASNRAELLSIVTLLAWSLPMYVIALGTNLNYHSKMLRCLYQERARERKIKNKNARAPPTLQKMITELVYGHLLLIGFMAQMELQRRVGNTFADSAGVIAIVIKFVTTILIWVNYTWFFAFYIYEFKLTFNGLPIQKRIKYFEERWVYFIGYGSLLGALYMSLPFWIATSFYLIYLNFMILNTINLKPPKNVNVHPKLRRLPIFFLPLHFANTMIRVYLHFTR